MMNNVSTLAILVIGVITVSISYKCVSSLTDKCPDPVLRNSLLFLTVLGAVLVSASATILLACKGACVSRGNLEMVFGVLLLILITASVAYSKYDCDSDRKKDLSYLLGISILGIAMCGALLFMKHTNKPSATASSAPGKFGYPPASLHALERAPLPPVHPARSLRALEHAPLPPDPLRGLRDAPRAPTSPPGSLSRLANAPVPPVRKRG